MLKILESLILVTIVMLCGFTATAHATAMLDPVIGSGPDVLQAIYAAMTGGHYAVVAALCLVGAVALARKYGGARWPALHTDLGSALLALCGAFGTSMVAALAGGGRVTIGMAEASGAVAFAAMGGYAAVNALLIRPYIAPWAARAPMWLRPVLLMVLYWFQHASDPAQAGNKPVTPGA